MKLCATCQFFARNEPVPQESAITKEITYTPNSQGSCRAHPPKVYMSANGMGCFFPLVKEEHWCGEWQEKEEAHA